MCDSQCPTVTFAILEKITKYKITKVMVEGGVVFKVCRNISRGKYTENLIDNCISYTYVPCIINQLYCEQIAMV